VNRFLAIGLLLATRAWPAGAFSSAEWLAKCADDSDARRLAAAYIDCTSKVKTPAENVVFPLETWPDGLVKSRLRAQRAYLFVDTGFIWGQGVRVEQYKRDGKTPDGWLEAEACVVDRKTRTGWVNGRAHLNYGKCEVMGRGVYFSLEREYLRICAESEIHLKDVKLDTSKLR